MKDEDKTKGQLINELAELRQRIDELKKSEALHKRAEEQLQRAHNQLERRVEKRIAELTRKNDELNQEIAECKKTEETLKASEKKYSAIVENSPDIIYILDPEGKFSFVGGAIGSLLGYTAEELKGNHFTSIIYPEDVKKAEWRFNERRTGERSTKKFEIRLVTKQGKGKYFDVKYLTVELHAFGIFDKPVSAKDKKFLGTYGVAREITDLKQAEEQIKASLQEKEVMLKEIHHRVKNNMQVISSLLKLQSRHIKNKEALEMFKESQSRLRLMALIHEKLYQSKDFTHVPFKDYLTSLIRSLHQSYLTRARNLELSFEIEEISLDISTAIPCGLIVNELVSNALKHAFPEERTGTITISLRSPEPQTYELVVSDDGIGLPEAIDPHTTKTLGLHLVSILVEDQLKGKITIEREGGTRVRISFKVG